MQKCAYTLYLSRLSPNSRRSIQSQLTTIGQILQWPNNEIPQRIQLIDYQSAMQCRSIMISEGFATRSVNRAMVALKGLLKVSVLLGNIDQIQLLQVQSIPNLKLNEYRGSPLSADQASSLIDTLNNAKTRLEIRNAAIVALFLGTGLRRSELVSLRLGDYDVLEHTLYIVKGKGNKSRIVFLPIWTLCYLDCWLSVRGLSEGYLFCGLPTHFNQISDDSKSSTLSKHGTPASLECLSVVAQVSHVNSQAALNGSTAYRIVKDLTAKIGLTGVSPHDFRRTFITRLLELNVDINTVRQMAGHASIITTTLYDKRDKRFMKQAADKLNYSE